MDIGSMVPCHAHKLLHHDGLRHAACLLSAAFGYVSVGFVACRLYRNLMALDLEIDRQNVRLLLQTVSMAFASHKLCSRLCRAISSVLARMHC